MNVFRWKEFWCNQKLVKNNKIPKEDETRLKSTGLNNDLKPTFGLKTENHGSEKLERLLTAVEGTPLKEDF